MFRPTDSRLVLVSLLVIALQATAAPGAKDKAKGADKQSGPTNAQGVPTIDGKIDLLRADPSQVDLAKVDPNDLYLTKQICGKIDFHKWDFSKVDIDKIKDPLVRKTLLRDWRSFNSREKTLDAYDDKTLARLQEENVQKWIEKPAPFREPEFKRVHQYDQSQIQRHAKAIDDLLSQQLRERGQDFNELTSDQQFVRRVYISIAGRIPTAEESQKFLSDKRTNKRPALIDELLLSEDYPLQMFNWLADMLRVQDLKSNQGGTESYQQWLIDQMAANRPWRQVVYDLLTAEGDLVSNPAVGWLVRDSGMPLGSLSNTLTTFMGAKVSCAECHDDPNGGYTRRQFYEMASFFGSTDFPGRNVRAVPKILKERYHYVKTRPDQFLTYPSDYPSSDFKANERVTPAFVLRLDSAPRLKGTSSNPLGREDFAQWMTNKNNQQFAATIANRLWAKLYGLPVKTPVTEMDDLEATEGNNPRLLRVIAQIMQDVDFDLMAFQRVLYNTRAFQAQASATPELGSAYLFPGPILRRMTADEAWDSVVTLVKGNQVNDYHRSRRAYPWSMDVLKEGAIEYLLELKQTPVGQEVASVSGQKAEMEDKKQKRAPTREIEFSPTISRASALQRELMGTVKSKKEQSDHEDPFVRASELNQPEAEKHFLRQFGQADRELANTTTLEGNIPQALMLMNGSVGQTLGSSTSYVMKRAAASSSKDGQVSYIYLSFLSREPTMPERDFIRSENISLQDLCWMLMNTHEFMFIQ